MSNKTKIIKKNAISDAETMEFGQKTMNLLQIPICWPISNRKVAPILAKLNFGAKKKQTPKQKFLKKCLFRDRND